MKPRFENIALASKEDKSFTFRDLIKAYWELFGVTKYKWLVLSTVLFVITFYTLVPPLILGKMVDLFATDKVTAVRPYMLYALGLGISFSLVAFTRLSIKYSLNKLITEVSYRIKVRGFEKLLDFSFSWHTHESAGAKTQRIKNGVEGFKSLYFRFNNEIMRSVASITGMIAVFLFLKPSYALFLFFYAGVFWIILTYFQKKIYSAYEENYLSTEVAGGAYVEGLSNILTIKTLGAGENFKNRIAEKEEKTKDFENKISRLNNHLWKTHQVWNGICYGTFLVLVGMDVAHGVISPGYLVIFYGYLNNLISIASDMMDVYEKIIDAKASIARMMGILWAKTGGRAGDASFSEEWSTIELRDVTFSHHEKNPERPDALHSLSLSIQRGEKIGIVGKTGSGKSTLAKLLTGLYEVKSGDYMIGDVSFYDLRQEDQTHEITLVLQETEIFNFSLRENITLLKNIPEETIERALKIAALEDVVAKLPEGLDTLVGEKGYHLSGGERQRVGIARAICKNTSILILDEATSSLDSKTESLIQNALDKELQDKTIISIAHRVSTLQSTDRIYVFDNGNIVESGAYDELITNKKSKFFELYNVQKKT